MKYYYPLQIYSDFLNKPLDLCPGSPRFQSLGTRTTFLSVSGSQPPSENLPSVGVVDPKFTTQFCWDSPGLTGPFFICFFWIWFQDLPYILLMVQKSGGHQLRLVIYPIICRVFIHFRWFAAFLPSTAARAMILLELRWLKPCDFSWWPFFSVAFLSETTTLVRKWE